MRVADLLQHLPVDTQSEVEAACAAANSTIRARLNDGVLRFRLRDAGSRTTAVHVVKDEVALPMAMADMRIPNGAERAAVCALFQRASRDLVSSATALERLLGPGHIEWWRGTDILPAVAAVTLEGAVRLGTQVQAVLKPAGTDGAFDLVRFLVDVREDVLGTYRPIPPDGRGEVRVYWGVVGLVAHSLGVDVRALAVVTLAHELAHGYTHLGADRDGNRWSRDSFLGSDRSLTEGIAQYYTHLVCGRMQRTYPGVREAYRALLLRQPEAYQTHLHWLLHATPERVAAALAQVRKLENARLEDMDVQLKAERPGRAAPQLLEEIDRREASRGPS